MMNIGELIKQLMIIRERYGELPVYVAWDSEGNGLDELDDALVDLLSDDTQFLDMTEDDKPNAVVIWPV